MRMTKYLTMASIALAVAAGLASIDVTAQSAQSTPAPTVGTWFGIARSCTSPSRFAQPPNTVNQSICREACQGAACPVTTFPIDEVVMMPEIFADGNMVATDHATLVDGHPIGQGRWEAAGTAVIDGKTYEKYQASFMWFQPRQPQDVDPNNPWSRFGGMAHPRFVMYYDPANPNIMTGYLQPFLFNITDKWGIATLQPGTPFLSPDPTATLPEVCDPTKQTNPYCFGTFMFVIKRVQTK
jgi:hypothetical protein